MSFNKSWHLFLLILFMLAGGIHAVDDSTREFRVIFPVTSVSSGLANALAKLFESTYNIPTKTYSLCTGDAITFIKNHEGVEEVDAMLGHDREAEEQFVREGYAVNLRSVFFSDFVLVGPQEDPAKIKGMTDPMKALKKIARKRANFCSRADLSGTHSLEMQVWKKAGIEPKGDWYIKTKVGTAETLLLAQRKRAYFISHWPTYKEMVESIDLITFMHDKDHLITTYEVLAMNPAKFPNIQYERAMLFIAFLTSPRTQKFISEFGKETYGQSIFYPMAVKQ